MRLYIDIEKLRYRSSEPSSEWCIRYDGYDDKGRFPFLQSSVGNRLDLGTDGPEFYLETDNDIAPNLPSSLQPLISWASLKASVDDPSHMSIIDCGEHINPKTSARAIVVRRFRFQKCPFIEITVFGTKPENVMELYHEILRGRQADEPYYKITSFKRWLIIRFRRFCRGWASMNAEMRGEAN